MEFSRSELFSIPNLLSYFRIVLIPFFIHAYLGATTPKDFYVAAGIVMLSGLTDLLDGLIARRFHMITELGKALDPFADKLTQAAIAICLCSRYRQMIWLVLLFVVKEFTMALVSFRLLRRKQKLDGALWYGKASTTVFYLMMIILIAFPTLPELMIDVMIALVWVFLLFSFVMYSRIFYRMWTDPDWMPPKRDQSEEEEPVT